MVNKNYDCFDKSAFHNYCIIKDESDKINYYIDGKLIGYYGGFVSCTINEDDIKKLYDYYKDKTYLWGIDTSNGSLVRLDHVEPYDDYIDIALDKLKENTKMYFDYLNNLYATNKYVSIDYDGFSGDWYVDNEVISWLTFDKENKKESNMDYFWYDLKAERVYAFALPGVGKENIKVRADERHLYIEAKSDLKNENAINSSTCGFDFDAEYKASFKLEKKFDLSRVDSKYVDGVLYVYIPFNDEYVLKDIKVK